MAGPRSPAARLAKPAWAVETGPGTASGRSAASDRRRRGYQLKRSDPRSRGGALNRQRYFQVNRAACGHNLSRLRLLAHAMSCNDVANTPVGAPTPNRIGCCFRTCFSGRCEPRPETIPRLAYRALAPPGLALIAIQQLRKRRLRRRISLRVARARRQPAQLDPMQQPVGTARLSRR